jgi:hypothetical protein
LDIPLKINQLRKNGFKILKRKHVLYEQSAAPPFQPWKHLHILPRVHSPWPEQEFGHMDTEHLNIKTKIIKIILKFLRSIKTVSK